MNLFHKRKNQENIEKLISILNSSTKCIMCDQHFKPDQTHFGIPSKYLKVCPSCIINEHIGDIQKRIQKIRSDKLKIPKHLIIIRWFKRILFNEL